jgi:hypothetical protein
MEDQPDVSAGTGRPEVLVIDIGETVALQATIGRFDLQLEGGQLGGFLHVLIELVQAGW